MKKRKVNIVWLSFILITISLNVGLYNYVAGIEGGYSLNDDQKSKLAEKLTLKGYKYLHQLGCNKPLAEYLNTGVWSDPWCAKHYSHVDRSEINNG